MLRGSSHLPASSAGHVIACLFGVAPGGGCLVSPLRAPRPGVGAFPHPSHFYETLPPCGVKARSADHVGLVSVALFLASRRAVISRHPTLWSPDFPLRAVRTIVEARLIHAQRLSGRLPISLEFITTPVLPLRNTARILNPKYQPRALLKVSLSLKFLSHCF